MTIWNATRVFAVLLFATAAPMTAAAADTPAPSGFNEPRPGLYTGGVPDAAALAVFADNGVGTVIDLRSADERARVDTKSASEALGLRYDVIAVTGAGDLTAENAERLKHAIDAADGKVLLHCASGNRVGALLALMAYHQEGATRSQALDFGRAAGLKSLFEEVDSRLRESGAVR